MVEVPDIENIKKIAKSFSLEEDLEEVRNMAKKCDFKVVEKIFEFNDKINKKIRHYGFKVHSSPSSGSYSLVREYGLDIETLSKLSDYNQYVLSQLFEKCTCDCKKK